MRETQRAGRQADIRAVKRRDFEQNRRRSSVISILSPPITPAMPVALVWVGDHRLSGVSARPCRPA